MKSQLTPVSAARQFGGSKGGGGMALEAAIEQVMVNKRQALVEIRIAS